MKTQAVSIRFQVQSFAQSNCLHCLVVTFALYETSFRGIGIVYGLCDTCRTTGESTGSTKPSKEWYKKEKDTTDFARHREHAR